MTIHAITRHIAAGFLLALLTVALLPGAASASSPAQLALETSISRILSSIKNPDYVNPATRGPLRQQIEDEVLHIFDFKEFSSRTVGPRWGTFSPAQQQQFSDAFAELLLNTYLSKIDGYNGEQVVYTGEVSSPKGDRTEVRTIITMKDSKKVPVAYRMLPKNGSWLVYDVLIENISLVKNYRTQFQDILNTGSPDQLIARVKAKAQEVRQAMASSYSSTLPGHLYVPGFLLAALLCLWHAPASAAPSQAPAPSTVYGKSPQLQPGAITVTPYGTMNADNTLDDYDNEPIQSISDPIEPWNRFWFHFNDIFFLYVAKPAYSAWETVTPHQLRSGLKNFFSNLLFPVRFVNNILQFRFFEAGVEFGRFVINTTSSAGFADVAKGHKTIVPIDPTGEDFGQTLGRWGLGHGFYIVWPIIGPSSARDTVGRAGDLFADPLFYLQPTELGLGVGGGLRFNALGDVLPLYEDLNTVAVDPYIAMREAYVNFRKAQVLH